ncbi:MAG: choice-of-anchor tandem repeat GloVer-containing protein [Candidatus Sulfotelmatobacter sp.]
MSRKVSMSLRGALAVLAAALSLAAVAECQEKVLYSFSDPGGAVAPASNLISDAAGNLYGTTFYGGAFGMGMVFELSPQAGGWTLIMLHSFNIDGVDGFFPTAGVIFDASGNLFGTTQFGGTGTCGVGLACGTVFELTPAGDGSWTEKVLHSFIGADGYQVHAGVILDGAGNLYGTTANGGSFSQGTIFELSPHSNGKWALRVLHNFTGSSDGGVPFGGVVLDAVGNLYGMTSAGGGSTPQCKYGCGVVFQLNPAQAGPHNGSVLHYFSRTTGDGRYPYAGLIVDAAGNLYGTTSAGGATNSGIVFELTPTGSGQWQETVLHDFDATSGDGVNPGGDLIFDASGNLYGVTLTGGSDAQGTAFELTPNGSAWTETILCSFTNQGSDGYNPAATLLLDSSGNLYGTTGRGGTADEGAVFEITR